jgi:hypothetical protein
LNTVCNTNFRALFLGEKNALINFELKTKERPMDEAGGSMVGAITYRRLLLE